MMAAAPPMQLPPAPQGIPPKLGGLAGVDAGLTAQQQLLPALGLSG